MRVWKWDIEVTDTQMIELPIGSKILDIQMQLGGLRLWALCNQDTTDKESRKIAIYGTSSPMPDDPGTYISTFQIYGGELVFHAFEMTTIARTGSTDE